MNMKFTFETSYKNNKYEIKLTVSNSMSLQTASKTITIYSRDRDISVNNQIENAIKSVLDNTRFTVQERHDAEIEAQRFIGFLKNDINAINPDVNANAISDEIASIFEEDDDMQQIDDEEIINEQ